MSAAEGAVLRQYYKESDYFMSPEGILKVLSVIVCIVSAALFLGGGGACGGGGGGGGSGGGLAASGAVVALACGAAMALLYAGALCAAPLLAPRGWLYTDLVVSAVMGVLLLVTAVLSITACRAEAPVDYVHGPLSLLTAALVTASAVRTYGAVMRRWDAARGPRTEPVRRLPDELDV